MSSSPSMSRRGLLVAGAALSLPATQALAQDAPAMARIRERGSLVVAVYKDFPPFNVDGKGIDVDLAAALAKAMGLKLSLLPFAGDENMGDDLRNMVWKGHYLGFGPADVMLHVPVQRPLMEAEDKVTIFAPYFAERVMIARDLQKVPKLESMEPLVGQKIAVAGQSTAGWLLIGSERGRFRDQLTTKLRDGTEAARLLLKGEVVAAAGSASELQSVLGMNPERYAIEPLPLAMHPGHRSTPIGCAVKKGREDLAREVQAAMNQLAESGELRRIFEAHQVAWQPA